jgi:hypothetical protein
VRDDKYAHMNNGWGPYPIQRAVQLLDAILSPAGSLHDVPLRELADITPEMRIAACRLDAVVSGLVRQSDVNPLTGVP